MENVSIFNLNGEPIEYYYQWDSGQKIVLSGIDIDLLTDVHFGHIDSEKAFVVTPVVNDGKIIASVPNQLLQAPKPIVVYLYNKDKDDGNNTIYSARITVIPRPKPDDYVYTETEVFTFASFDGRIKEVENTAAKIDSFDGRITTIEDTAFKNVADKIYHAFTTTGSIVTCEPPEGYPLEVEWKTKNLATTDILVGASGITENDGVFSGFAHDFYIATRNGGLVAGEFEEGQQYVFSVYVKKDLEDSSPYLRIRYTDGTATNNIITAIDDFERVSVMSTSGKTVASVSFDYSGSNPTLHIKDIQIEKGATATAYEPYAETATITRCGKNLFDFTQAPYRVTYVNASGNSNTRWGFAVYLPAGTYTLHAEEITPSKNEYFLYGTVMNADGTYQEGCALRSGPNNHTRTVTLEAGDSILLYDGNGGSLQQAIDSFAKFNIQCEAGSVITAFEPYAGETFAPGDTVPALPGVNTIFADAGILTVNGRNYREIPGMRFDNGGEVFNDYSNIASGDYAHAEGTQTKATNVRTHAEGYLTEASGDTSHAEGSKTKATNTCAHSEGFTTSATGVGSHAEGGNTVASGDYSHTEGQGTKASGRQSHAEGQNTTASGDFSHAQGYGTVASGSRAHAEGHCTIANGNWQHAQGKFNEPDTLDSDGKGEYVRIVGNGEGDAKRSNAETLDWHGNHWVAGKNTAKDFVLDGVTGPLGSLSGMGTVLGNDIIVLNPDKAGTIILQENTYYQILGTNTNKTLTMYNSNNEVTKTMNFRVLTIYCGSMTDSAKYGISQNMPTANLMAIGNDTGLSALSGAEVYCTGFRKNWPDSDKLNEVFRAEVSYPAGSWIIMQTKSTSNPQITTTSSIV